MHVRDWWADRKLSMTKEQRQYLRECIREQVAILKSLDPKYFRIFSASSAVGKSGGYMQPDGTWGDKVTGARFEPAQWASDFWPDNLPADAVWKVR